MTTLDEFIIRAIRWAERRQLSRMISGGRVEWGRSSYGTPKIRVFANDSTRLHVGNFTSIGPNVEFILGGNHPVDRGSTFPIRERHGLPGAGTDGFPSSKGDIRVGHDVWIGARVLVLSGVEIGDGAVVAAGAVVSRNIPPYAVAAGVPAKVVGWRCSPETVGRLRRLAWWDWDERFIADNAFVLNDLPIEESVARLEEIAVAARRGSE